MINHDQQPAEQKKREYMKNWRKQHAEHIRDYHKNWRRQNKDKVRAAQDRYWLNKSRQADLS